MSPANERAVAMSERDSVSIGRDVIIFSRSARALRGAKVTSFAALHTACPVFDLG